MRLSFVKLFILFFPLVRLAFLAPICDRVCRNDRAVAAAALLGEKDTDSNVKHLNEHHER